MFRLGRNHPALLFVKDRLFFKFTGDRLEKAFILYPGIQGGLGIISSFVPCGFILKSFGLPMSCLSKVFSHCYNCLRLGRQIRVFGLVFQRPLVNSAWSLQVVVLSLRSLQKPLLYRNTLRESTRREDEPQVRGVFGFTDDL